MSRPERAMPDISQRSLDADAIRHELLAATDAEIEAAVRFSDPMSLRGLIYQLTGDPALLDVNVVKQRVFLAEAVVPASDADVAFIQERAATFLKQYRDSGARALDLGPVDRLPQRSCARRRAAARRRRIADVDRGNRDRQMGAGAGLATGARCAST